MADSAQAGLSNLLKTTRSIRTYTAPYLREDNGYIVLMCLSLAAITIANTAMIWFLGTAVNHLTNNAFDQLTLTLIWLAFIVVLNQLMQFAYFYSFQWVYLRFVARIRKATLLHIMHMTAFGSFFLISISMLPLSLRKILSISLSARVTWARMSFGIFTLV